MEQIKKGLVLLNGPMFGKKSTTIQNWAENLAENNIPVLVINSNKDTRYTQDKGYIVTHDLKFLSCKSYENNIPNCEDLLYKDYEYILIDEVHLFGAETIVTILMLVLGYGKTVVCATLNNDLEGKSFPLLDILRCFATDIKQCLSFCDNCRDAKKLTHPNAIVTVRKFDAKNENIIGGKDNYKVLCSDCYVTQIETQGVITFKSNNVLDGFITKPAQPFKEHLQKLVQMEEKEIKDNTDTEKYLKLKMDLMIKLLNGSNADIEKMSKIL
jgi:thymidine kinase